MRVNRTSRRRRLVAAAPIGIVLAVGLAGCSADEAARGWLPESATNITSSFTQLWQGAWIAALAIGVLVWGLTFWCITAYRKRHTVREDGVHEVDGELPRQTQYNIPLEIAYIIVPLVMIGVYFGFTAVTMENAQATDKHPDVTIEVIGQQWSWTFNYLDSDVYSIGEQPLPNQTLPEDQLQTLYLPEGKRVEFIVESRDVAHSFYIPAFQYKKDAIPGMTNKFQIVPTRQGTFIGRCAELCGEAHAQMLFKVQVVPQGEYDAAMAALKAEGNTGRLGMDYNRKQNVPAQEASDGGS